VIGALGPIQSYIAWLRLIYNITKGSSEKSFKTTISKLCADLRWGYIKTRLGGADYFVLQRFSISPVERVKLIVSKKILNFTAHQ